MTKSVKIIFNGGLREFESKVRFREVLGVSAKLTVDFFVKKFSLLNENYLKVADKK